ncbi:hypothetical protein M231_03295 [Tremella mesenterica]|uniref:Uncharacterized protein n=2 Tax=Tremella mesenterica TaxID=5217 RepID=A0A4Q1BNZ6_TREME|nr:hypothetical protein M231_03295 [Tremella mesenterica]
MLSSAEVATLSTDEIRTAHEEFKQTFKDLRRRSIQIPSTMRLLLRCAAKDHDGLVYPFTARAHTAHPETLLKALSTSAGLAFFINEDVGAHMCTDCTRETGGQTHLLQLTPDLRRVLRENSGADIHPCPCGNLSLVSLWRQEDVTTLGILYPVTRPEQSGDLEGAKLYGACSLTCVLRGFMDGYIASTRRWKHSPFLYPEEVDERTGETLVLPNDSSLHVVTIVHVLPAAQFA